MVIDMQDERSFSLTDRMTSTFSNFTGSRYVLLLKIMLADSAAEYGEFGCVCTTQYIMIGDDGVITDTKFLERRFGISYQNISDFRSLFEWQFDRENEDIFKNRHVDAMKKLHLEAGIDLNDEMYRNIFVCSSDVVNGSQHFDLLLSFYDKTFVADNNLKLSLS